MSRFKKLLQFELEDHVLNTIAGSGWLSSRIAVVRSPKQAVALYNDAVQIPGSLTRAEVQRESNVAIAGTIPIAGSRTATFHYAFDDGIPRVLKIPQAQGQGERECALYDDVGIHAEFLGLSLVPVRKLKLRGSIRTNRLSPEKLAREGILMPPYWCTLGDIPPPVSTAMVLKVLHAICPALELLDDSGWIHGDVKPSNIFLDTAGNPWLGDYGSSVKQSDAVAVFSGGTPKYQLPDVCVEQGGRFDRVGLALSLLEVLGVKLPNNGTLDDFKVLLANTTTMDMEIKERLAALCS